MTTCPITSRDVTFNILAPGTVQDHVTVGVSYAIDRSSEISAMYGHAFRKEVTGASLFNNILGPGAGGNEKIWLSEDVIGIGWSMRF